MTTEEVKCKLAAILHADVKGYSRLMGEDEESTARTLNVYKGMMTGFVQHHRGRVVGSAGDSMLAGGHVSEQVAPLAKRKLAQGRIEVSERILQQSPSSFNPAYLLR